MTRASVSFVRDAVVLAAGNGDRFQNGTRQSKLLQNILGQPLIVRTLSTAAAAGITAFEVVLGYQADSVREAIERGTPPGTTVHFTYNPEWRLENGVSVATVRDRFQDRRFAVLMGDHLFEPPVLSMLLDMSVPDGESVLAVDTQPAPPDVAAEATQVRMEGSYITAIGKELGAFDALDTGLFVCSPALFDALATAFESGDTTLSGGIRELAARRLMRGADVCGAPWHDIDTLEDLASAESLLGGQPEPDPA
ncbi:MAG: NTP transferase domain-containing protein [Acidobacteriota bacterium]|nr:NTP transferase domain-containing protein [Acidobacteriota bacterium]